MRRILLAVSALTAVVAAGAFSGVSAAPLGNPAALAGAVEETGVIDSVRVSDWASAMPKWARQPFVEPSVSPN